MSKRLPYLLSGLLLLPLAAGAAPRPAIKRPPVRKPPPATAPKVTRLAILPDRVRLDGPPASQRLVVMATLADGSRRDVTTRATLIPLAPRVAGVDGTRLVAKGDGHAGVAAKFGGLKALAGVSVTNSGRPIVYSFRNDVIPVMAHVGCSQGTCHGANSGKGGFKLTLRGYGPELDYLSITRQLGGRRISREDPQNSLLLRKPMMRVPHGGGKVLEKDSPEYYVLLGWLLEGAPGLDEKEPRLVSLDALPGDRTYRPNEKQQVLIRAKFSDGHVEDVTDRAVYRSNDVGTATVTDTGEIQALTPGATAVQAKYMDQLAVVRVTVPYPQKIEAAAFPKPANYVDEAVYAGLRDLNLEPSPRCTDQEFLRRAYIDAIGTLPTAEEARAFLADPSPDRREKLIDAVLRRPEFGSIWALKICDVSMVRKEHMGRKYTVALNQWLTEQFQSNRPWDRIVKDLVTASGSTEENPAALWWVSRQATRPNSHGWVRSYELTGEIVAQAFLGQRIQCCKCHNHPTEKYTQNDYYHFASIFAQVNGDGKADPVPDRLVATDGGEVRQPRTGELMVAQPLDRADLHLQKDDDRRAKFAEWLTGEGRDMFARNIVNRLWARLFGMGIVDPVDDLRSTNPPRNEPLMAALARDMIEHRYDMKYLIATIMRSNTYQSSSVPTPKNRIDTQFFSHYPVRRMQGEELLDAIAQVTDVPDRFATYAIGTRAIELSDTELPSLSLDTFGRPVRTTPCECDRSDAPSLSQALDLFNGETLQGKLKNPNGIVAQLLKTNKSDGEIVDELFLRAVARPPAVKERNDCVAAVQQVPNRAEGMQDVLWALINSKEFMFNH